MKVVLFCGGVGMRLRDYSDSIPKPMVPVGQRPILWHVMKYYAHFGHKEFILCLGHKGNVIKDYFLSYNECASNNFVLDRGGKLKLLGTDIQDWKITFVDTGLNANIGERLLAVREFLGDDEVFLANYSDGVSDLPLPDVIDFFHRQQSVVTCVGVHSNHTFHLIEADEAGTVHEVSPISKANLWINGGYYVLSRKFFDFIEPGEELVEQPFNRLIERKLLSIYKYSGYWTCMDTFKDKQSLDDIVARGTPPWELWAKGAV